MVPEIDRIPQLNLVVLLDGLDEVLPDVFDLATRKIARFLELYPLATIVVSCRTNHYTTFIGESELNTLRNFESFRLNQLDYDTIINYLDNINKKNRNSFLEAVNSKRLYELLKIPYYLIKLSKQFQDTGKIVNSKAELFEDEIKQLIRKEIARTHSSNHELLEKKLYSLLNKVAFVMEVVGISHISTSELERVIPKSDDRQLVINAAAIFYGTEGLKKTWRFHHHNTQEFLTAKILATKPFNFIKKIIGIGPDYKKARPSWVDTILFLNSILAADSPLKIEITNWLIENNKDLIIRLEPEKLDIQIRERVFKQIFNLYKKDARRINSNLYRYENLANFAEGTNTLNFLIKELSENAEVNNLANALEIAVCFDLKKYPKYYLVLKEIFKNFLFGPESSLHYSSLLGYTEQYKLSIEEFNVVYQKFRSTESDLIRSQLFRGIENLSFQEEFLDDIIAHVKIIVHEEHERFKNQKENTRLGTEYMEVAKCLAGLKSESSLIALFTKLNSSFLSFARLRYFEKTLHLVLENALVHKTNRVLVNAVVDIFVANHSYILHNLDSSEAFLKYFTESGCIESLSADLCRELNLHDNSMINTISVLSSRSTVDVLFDLYQSSKIDSQAISSFNYFFEKNNNAVLIYFREKFSIPEPIPRPTSDFQKDATERNNRNLNALFVKDEFKKEINLIFNGFKKDTLSYSDIDYSKPDFWSNAYAGVARDYLNLRPQGSPITLKATLEHLEHTWEPWYFSRIYEYLIRNDKAELNQDQADIVTNWCNLNVGLVNFNTAIDYESSGSLSLDRNAIMLCYFIRKLHLVSYEKELYLDMLSFIKSGDSLVDIIEFVERIAGVSNAEIGTRILSNLHIGVDNPRLLDNYLDFIKENNLTEAATLLVPYLQKEELSNRSDILNVFVNLGGDINELQFILSSTSGDFLPYLIEEFIKQESLFIRRFLIDKFKKESKDLEKLKLAKYLIKLQEEIGLAFYIDFIKKRRFIPDDSSPANPLFCLTKPEFTFQILELIKLAHDPNIKYDHYRNLKSISFNCLQNLALHENNFESVKRRMFLWNLKQRLFSKMHLNALPDGFFKILKFYWEGITQQYQVNAGNRFTFEEAMELYNKIA